MPAEKNEVVSAQVFEATRALISKVIPVCTICGLTIRGHLFKHVASTPIHESERERAKKMLECIRVADWEALRQFQEGDGLSTNVAVVGLKCVDGCCSLAALLCPCRLEDPYVLLLQELVPDCAGPLAGAFWGEI